MVDRHTHEPVKAGYEKRDINVGKVALYAGVLVVAITLAGIGASFLTFKYLARTMESEVAPPSPLYDLQQAPPEPRLLAQPWRNMAELRVAGEQHLATYGWIDMPNGVVRIPIGRAMELLARQGLPARPDGLEVAPPAAADSAPKPGLGGKK